MRARRLATGPRRLTRGAYFSGLFCAGVLLSSSLALGQEPEPEAPAPAPDAPSEDAPTGEPPSEAVPDSEVLDADAPEAEAEPQETVPPPSLAPASPPPAPPPAGMVAAGSETTSMEIGSDSVPARERPNDYTSQHFAFELRFGPYQPKVDDSPGLIRLPIPCEGLLPYECVFGDKARLMMGFEFDWQIWRAPHVGTIGVGLGWGYTQMSGLNKIPENQNPAPVAQESSLNIMPFNAVAVGRFDVFSREFHVPLVPYGKFGFSYARWWVKNGRGLAKSDPPAPPDPNDPNAVPAAASIPGKGFSRGTQAALGIMLQLDWIERSAAVTLDNETGINNSYLFFEWSASDYPGDQMNVGSSNWVTGIAFEM